MDLHGRFSDVIASRDVLVRVASDDALQDVALPARKGAAWLRLRSGHTEALTLRLGRSFRHVAVFERWRSEAGFRAITQGCDSRGGQHDMVGDDEAEGTHKGVARHGREEVSARAGSEDGLERLQVELSREHRDPGVRKVLAQVRDI